MFEDDQDDDQQQQQDILDREQRAMDCLMVCHKHGVEGTANEFAALLGLSKEWNKARPKERIAA